MQRTLGAGFISCTMDAPSFPLKTEAHTLKGRQPQTSLDSIW